MERVWMQICHKCIIDGGSLRMTRLQGSIGGSSVCCVLVFDGNFSNNYVVDYSKTYTNL